jgi:uncharacterized protein (TIGR02246 family)
MRVLVAVVVAGLVVYGVLGGKDGASGGRQPQQSAAPGGDGRDADRQAILKTTEGLFKAVEGGNAKAVVGFFTEQGEYSASGGIMLRGRAAIAKAYTEFFKTHPKIKFLRTDVDGVRFLSKDTAIEEGSVKVQKSDTGEPVTNRYSILYVREGGNWLVAMLHEGSTEAVALSDLDWLVGQWKATKDGVEMQVKYEWTFNKTFLLGRFTVKDGDKSTEGVQYITRDPATGQLRSWSFESEGGFGNAYWTREGKTWVVEASGVQADGSILTAVNVVTTIDANAFTWQSTQRTIDGENVGDLPPVLVTRVKPGN